MAGPVKRLRYFDEQFLHATDFNDSEGYHIGMRRRHNRMLHTPGVSDGLVVAPASATAVSVTPGGAVDPPGRDIALEDLRTVDLAALPSDATAYIVIAYAEKPSDPSDETGVLDDTRWTEEPRIQGLAAPPTNADEILLATVTRTGQNVTTVDNGLRPIAGVREAQTKVNRSGDQVTGDLTIAGRLGVGTTAPAAKLQVTGGAIMPAIGSGPAAGIQFPSDPGGGAGDEAFIRYFAEAGETTTLLIGTENDLQDRVELHQAGDRRLTVHAGNVGIGTRTPTTKLDVAGDISISGRLALQGSDAWLRLNQQGGFPNGVHTPGAFSADRLNVGGALGWADPGSTNAWFQGNVGIGATVFAATPITGARARLTIGGGDLHMGAGSTIYNPGRQHVHVEDALYLLPKAGLLVTMDWGASGNLHVDGDVRLAAADRRVYIGGNQDGIFMQLHDDLWFADPQNGNINLRNGDDTGWGRLVGLFQGPCSAEYKTGIEVLSGAELSSLLDDSVRTDIVRFRYCGEEEHSGRERIGVIAERCPAHVLGADGKSLHLQEYASMLHGAIKALHARVAHLEGEPGSTIADRSGKAT